MELQGERTRAQKSTNSIERLYITMRHLFNRGFYGPHGVSGQSLKKNLLILQPEIYGSIADSTKTELDGLLYVIERLPKGIEECQIISLSSSQGLHLSHLKPIIPNKRRRICYRIDEVEMLIEITRGKSEIYDILTHLTFLFIESDKIMKNAISENDGVPGRAWDSLESLVLKKGKRTQRERENVIIHLTLLLGRSYSEIKKSYQKFSTKEYPDRLFEVIYWIGKRKMLDEKENKKLKITFSNILQERIGHHLFGELWAKEIKKFLFKNDMFNKSIHIISANMHSFMNVLYAREALLDKKEDKKDMVLYAEIGLSKDDDLRQKVFKYACDNGMTFIKDNSGANLDVQIFDCSKIKKFTSPKNCVILVMDYAFGEQAYEVLEELLKPYKLNDSTNYLNVSSISIMGKAGILKGDKGDIIIPYAHIFEGTADNYPIENEFSLSHFINKNVKVCEGSMITVLGTSLQNKDLLEFFKNSTWNAVGLEMEGAHYQKAIQAATKIRKSISPKVKVRYAYYASDNPLKSGGTLASGGLGKTGIPPTYLITEKILDQIFID